MKPGGVHEYARRAARRIAWAPASLLFILPFVARHFALFAAPAASPAVSGAVVKSKQGSVEFSPGTATTWTQPTNDQRLYVRDRLRTLKLGQASVQMQDLSVVRLKEWSLLEMLPPREVGTRVEFSLKTGAAYFLHRNEPRQIGVETPAVRAGIDGTEFHLLVEADGRTVLTLIDGKVTMSNPAGTLSLVSGEQGVAVPGQGTLRTAKIETRNIIQWCLYYPGVLDPDELGLTAAETAALTVSLDAYRNGDLLEAFASYPEQRLTQPRSLAEQIYHSGLRLSSGQVTNYTEFETNLDFTLPLAAALRSLIAAVNAETNFVLRPATNASQFLGRSYFLQSRYQLREALEAARAAVSLSTNFAFGWERVAELEFSFGNRLRAEAALARSLRLAPRNAQAHALQGFLSLGRDRLDEALGAFNHALELDIRLGHAWLGRGLCRLRQGRSDEGLAAIEQGAVMEPTRWLLRSYLGKAFTLAAEDRRNKERRPRLLVLAEEELELAKREDPLDPTPWLYSALLLQQQNRNVEAVRSLEQSVALNDNRQVFRSRLLLDEDRAVRSANLARVYERAGLPELSIQEAARAVNANYAEYDAHRFLADSFNALRDPKRVNLRDEAIWSSEQLLANLLTAGGGGSLSRFTSQQEYGNQFRLTPTGLFTATEYGSDGDWRETASHFGTFNQLSYALDLDYQHLHGDHPNGQLDRLEWFSQIKLKLGEDDSVFVQTKYQDLSSGDVVQRYDPNQARKDFKFSEVQEPLLFAGYQHQWSEGVQTLFLGSRLVNDLRYSDRGVPDYILGRDTPTAPIQSVDYVKLYDLDYRDRFEIYSAELNQIFKLNRQTFVFGARYQAGSFETANRLANATNYQPIAGVYLNPPAGDQNSNMERASAYLYDTVEIAPRLLLTAGLSYDHLTFPENLRSVPISTPKERREQISPKAALQWTPAARLTLRAAYAQSLTGVSFDESVRLEPTQLAGFIQSFRNIIPESLVGSLSGARHETGGVALDWPFRPGSFLGLQAEWLKAGVTREMGVFDFILAPGNEKIVQATTPERLDYRERSVAAVLNHHYSREWSFGGRYKFTRSELDRTLKEVPLALYPSAQTSEQADLHQLELSAQYEHSSGLYARFQPRWSFQQNSSLPDENLWQFDLFVGWRFWNQRIDATLGLLNLTDRDYRLNPLTPHTDLPRHRTLVARLRANF